MLSWFSRKAGGICKNTAATADYFSARLISFVQAPIGHLGNCFMPFPLSESDDTRIWLLLQEDEIAAQITAVVFAYFTFIYLENT